MWGRGKGRGGVFELEDFIEGGGCEPWRREDVGAALAFEEEGKPEREGGAVGWL